MSKDDAARLAEAREQLLAISKALVLETLDEHPWPGVIRRQAEELLLIVDALDRGEAQPELMDAMSSLYSLLSLIVHRKPSIFGDISVGSRDEAIGVLIKAEPFLKKYWESSR